MPASRSGARPPSSSEGSAPEPTIPSSGRGGTDDDAHGRSSIDVDPGLSLFDRGAAVPAGRRTVRVSTTPAGSRGDEPNEDSHSRDDGRGPNDVHREFWGEEPEPVAAQKPDRKLLARRRTHIVRHVSPWSLFKLSLLFYLCLWVALLFAGAMLWRLGDESGLVANAESFWAEATGQDAVDWDGRSLFRVAAAAGGILSVAGTGFTVLAAVLFNAVSDLTGGIRLRVLEVLPASPNSDASEDPPTDATNGRRSPRGASRRRGRR